MSILRLEPPIPLDTPKGKGLAIIFRDPGAEMDDWWTVIIDETREIWTFQNRDVRAQSNVTIGRK